MVCIARSRTMKSTKQVVKVAGEVFKRPGNQTDVLVQAQLMHKDLLKVPSALFRALFDVSEDLSGAGTDMRGRVIPIKSCRRLKHRPPDFFFYTCIIEIKLLFTEPEKK
jgi:hypothetical protein